MKKKLYIISLLSFVFLIISSSCFASSLSNKNKNSNDFYLMVEAINFDNKVQSFESFTFPLIKLTNNLPTSSKFSDNNKGFVVDIDDFSVDKNKKDENNDYTLSCDIIYCGYDKNGNIINQHKYIDLDGDFNKPQYVYLETGINRYILYRLSVLNNAKFNSI